ncbi:MAG: alpha/beta fold hydrolase [Spirochaetia bacterium]|jgi:pimeloyl-ACP methyl ester carboxylesterase
MNKPEGNLEAALVSTEEEAQRVGEMLRDADRPAPRFWEPGVGEEILVSVEGAQIRVLHFPAADPATRRPVVFVPGFGATPEGFQDFYAAVRDRAELFYLETREKASSAITARRPDMSVSRSAHDIQDALAYLGLSAGRDFVLMAPCWGAAIVLQGLIEGCIDAPTIVAADPMHTLWFPKWLLRYISPLLPVAFVRALRPLLARSMLGNMEEPTQRERAYAFVYGADIFKWKRSAEAARNFELFGRLSAVSKEVFVLNGTHDKIHDQRHYPAIARELSRGRFLYMRADESDRERLFGVAALEFARVSAGEGLPPSLSRYEKNIR